jgi:hypothetical protein
MQSTLTQGGVLQFVGPGGQTYYEASPTRPSIQPETPQGDGGASDDEDNEDDDDSSNPNDIQYVRTNVIPQPTTTLAHQPFHGIVIPPTSELG